MVINRIDLADIGSPDRMAAEIVRLIPDLPVPVPIEELALQLDISSIEELTTEGFDGGLFTDENKGTGFILVKDSAPRQRRRFTVGHELFHFLCPTHVPLTPDGFLCTADDMRLDNASAQNRAKRMEVEANSFSAQMLMPTKHFLRDVRRSQTVGIEQILRLAQRYDTSKEATARRYAELHHESCAIVVSRYGKVLRVYKSKNFPFIETFIGGDTPAGSLSRKLSQRIGEVSDLSESDAAVWLPSGRRTKLPTLYEQVMPQHEGYMLTFLNVELKDEDDDNEELTESYTPRFHK